MQLYSNACYNVCIYLLEHCAQLRILILAVRQIRDGMQVFHEELAVVVLDLFAQRSSGQFDRRQFPVVATVGAVVQLYFGLIGGKEFK